MLVGVGATMGVEEALDQCREVDRRLLHCPASVTNAKSTLGYHSPNVCLKCGS
jgi:hypothetical protein